METIYQGGFRPTPTTNTTRRAAINGLAVVGFIALIIIGITLAIYSARFVPTAVSRIASASVFLSSFRQNAAPALTAVTATSTLPFADATSTPAVATTTDTTDVPATTPAEPTKNTTPAAGHATTHTVTYPTTAAPVALYGLPDLSVNLVDVGYLANGNSNSFVATHTVPAGDTVALKFEITNNGTNATGNFSFKASVPTNSTYTYYADSQQSLNPGDTIQYILSFDRAQVGKDESITVTVDQDNKITESNEGNNSATAYVTVN